MALELLGERQEQAMIDIKKIKDLIKLMVVNDLTELDLEGEGERVTLKRDMGQTKLQHYAVPMAASPMPDAAGGEMAANVPAGASNGAAEGDQATDKSTTISCPMVGTFYTSSSPDAKPFVTVGDQVNEDTVVCIVEAMKVFNEIKAEMAGTIEKILVASGQAVEFEQPLFLVRSD